MAASTYSYGALFNLDRAVYDTMLSDRKWDKVLTDELLLGDVASLGEWLYLLKEFLYYNIKHSQPSALEYRDHHSCRLAARPRQVYRQCCHVLAGINASPEGINRAVGADACFDADEAHKNAALFGVIKVLQSSPCPQALGLQ